MKKIFICKVRHNGFKKGEQYRITRIHTTRMKNTRWKAASTSWLALARKDGAHTKETILTLFIINNNIY